jgi:hypothetical protein
MATGKTILKAALRLLNVKASVDSLSASELEDGKEVFNQLIDEWSNQKLLQPALVEITHTLTANDGQYSIGSGGDINTTRPIKIENALIRTTDNQDYQVDIVESRVWQTIHNKQISSSYPRSLYYRASYPLAEINLYPLPDNAYTLVMQVWSQITQITNMDATLALPPGYEKAMKYCLAMDLAPEYGKQATQHLMMTAESAKTWIKTANYGQVQQQLIEAAWMIGRAGRRNVNNGGIS